MFTQYERFSRKSGLLLNVDKTEILVLNFDIERDYVVVYMGKRIRLKTIKEVKICGIWYCNNIESEYNCKVRIM